MRQRMDVWTFLIITSVSVVVWGIAFAKTRESASREVSIQLQAPAPEGWLLRPGVINAVAEVDGSRWAMRRFDDKRSKLRLELVPDPGNPRQTLQLTQLVREHPDVRETGITIAAVEPATAVVTLEPIDRKLATVQVRLPTTLEGNVEAAVAEPAQVELVGPRSGLERLGATPSLHAVVDRERLERLLPGPHAVPAEVKPAPGLELPADVLIAPAQVTVTLTIKSQIRTVPLESPVRIKLVTAPEDTERVEFEPKQFLDVRVTADDALIAEIESKKAVVVALLYLKSHEKEARLASKRIAGFMVERADGRFEPLAARVGDETNPVVNLAIREAGAD